MIEKIPYKLLKILHYLLLLFLIFGVFLPPKYLIYYLFLWPLIYLHWYFNNDKCMLTELESHFDPKRINVHNNEEVMHYKYVEIFKKLKKIDIYFDSIDSFTSYAINIIMICWVVGVIRLVNYYKKNISYVWRLLKNPLGARILNDKYK